MAKHKDQQSSTSLALSGSGGSGAITAGGMLLKAAARAGLYGLFTRAVGPQIRGGEAAALLRLARRPVEAVDDHCHILVAMDWLNIERFGAELGLDEASLVIADPAAGEIPETIMRCGARIVELPLQALAKSVKRGRPNMVAVGVAGALTGIPRAALQTVVEETITAKGEVAVAASLGAFEAGFEAATALNIEPRFELNGDAAKANGTRWIINGNEAAGFGAIRGGVRFVAAYPITPATEILEWMAPALAETGGSLVQAEDELASINMIIGAAYGGVPSLTATSGPGLALMMESIGLAIASEVPIVIVDVMRGGPSTGIPTKSEQSDLNIAVYGCHGDAPHICVAPVSVADCLFTTQWAVHLAESLQVPAIVLSDQFLGQAKAVIDRPGDIAFMANRKVEHAPSADYARYAITDDGVSPMALPGTPGGQYTADGLEHSIHGTPSAAASDHMSQLDKRQRKLTDHQYGQHWAELEGQGTTAVVTWGSTVGPVREALARLRADGSEIRLVAPRLLAPAQPERLRQALDGVTRILVIEQSHSGQFLKYLRAHYDLPGEIRHLCRPGPLTFRPGEIEDALKEWS